VLIISSQTRLVDISPALRFMRFNRIDWKSGTAHSSRRVMRSVRSGICSPTSTHPYLVVLILHRTQRPSHTMPVDALPLVCFDIVRNSGVTALGGAIATVIMILTLAEF
jgi:hypothetical protein